jgi:serine/threonine-protein kinase HipA
MVLPVLCLQIHQNGQWRRAAAITLLGDEADGELAATKLEYDLDYALEQMADESSAALSLLHPVSLESKILTAWPSFLLDLLPQGHAMKFVEKYYKISDQRKNYWKILATCKLFPPGNVRIETPDEPPLLSPKRHSLTGFSVEDVVAKGEDFLEHMLAAGAPVAGTTGASGAAPKFLLREDMAGRFHADSALDDAKTKTMWLVKFPRGKAQSDLDILKTEAIVHHAAGHCGLRTYGQCYWRDNALFIERFDRFFSEYGKVEFLGLESFYSALGSVTFGEFRAHEDYLQVIARFSSAPEEDIAEYLVRDLLSRMIGNTDNHGRNSSFLKNSKSVRVSPLYDMAPMAWDSEGIVRSTRWRCSDENLISALANIILENKLDSDLVTTIYLEKCKGLLEFWRKLEEQNGVEPFLERSIREQDMLVLVQKEQKRFSLLRRKNDGKTRRT